MAPCRLSFVVLALTRFAEIPPAPGGANSLTPGIAEARKACLVGPRKGGCLWRAKTLTDRAFVGTIYCWTQAGQESLRLSRSQDECVGLASVADM
jgi:hypothetical protein